MQTSQDTAPRGASPTATRLDLLQPPGCSARFPFLSFALPVITLNAVNLAVLARLMWIFSQEQRDAFVSVALHHVASHYDLRTRLKVKECLACHAVDVVHIEGELDASWRTIGALADFAERLLRWEVHFNEAHRDCSRSQLGRVPDPMSPSQGSTALP